MRQATRESLLKLKAQDELAAHFARIARMIGDALAWNALGQSHRHRVLLGRNEVLRGLPGGVGLEGTLALARAVADARMGLPLIHDLTSTLRVGDLTILAAADALTVELKSHGSGLELAAVDVYGHESYLWDQLHVLTQSDGRFRLLGLPKVEERSRQTLARQINRLRDLGLIRDYKESRILNLTEKPLAFVECHNGKLHYQYENIVRLWELSKSELPRPAYRGACLWRDASWSEKPTAMLNLVEAHGNWLDAGIPISNLDMDKTHLFTVAYSHAYFENTRHPSLRPLFDLPFPEQMLSDMVSGRFLVRTILDIDDARRFSEAAGWCPVGKWSEERPWGMAACATPEATGPADMARVADARILWDSVLLGFATVEHVMEMLDGAADVGRKQRDL